MNSRNLMLDDVVEIRGTYYIVLSLGCYDIRLRELYGSKHVVIPSDSLDLHPVELTPQILYSLGFVKSQFDIWQLTSSNGNFLDIEEFEDEYFVDISGCRIIIRFVHELRHLLLLQNMEISHNELVDALKYNN